MTYLINRAGYSRVRLRLLESEARRGDSESLGQSVAHVVGRVATASLDAGDVGLIDSALGCKVVLREPSTSSAARNVVVICQTS